MIAFLREGDYRKAFSSLINNHSGEANICLTFLIKYVLYSIYAAKEVGEDIKAADTVMASGYNWAPPLSIIEALGGANEFKKIAAERLEQDYLQGADLDSILESVPLSSYDYRRYFKAIP